MSVTLPNLTAKGAAACSVCPRAASFQARVESPADAEHPFRRANACASHLVEVIEELRAWARARQLADGLLTVLAIDPYALPWLAARGITDHGFAFYTAPVTPLPLTLSNPGRPA
ncbi:MAG TPA: hypothetical protein VI365_24720 [Trebonia sp.]